MEKISIIFLLFVIILISGCVVENKETLQVNLYTEKDTFALEEPFNLSLNIDYDGEPFTAAIIYDFYREGFSKHFYDGYIEEISTKDVNRSRFHAGYSAEKAFRIYGKGFLYPADYFLDEGIYHINVYVYKCDDISKEGYNCTQDDAFPSRFGLFDETPELLIKNNIKPLASAEKQITVRGGNVECRTDSDCEKTKCDNCVLGHYRCSDISAKPECIECNGEIIINGKRTMCKEGFTCKNYQCVEDPLFCKSDADCKICEGCQDGKQFCDSMNQCKDCDWSDRPCKEGYICEDWGCTNIEVLKSLKDCESTEDCGTSDKRVNPKIECTNRNNPLTNQKCLECWNNYYQFKDGYHCYNYECVPD